MDALVAIGIMVALVGIIRWLTMQVCPWGMRAVEQAVKRLLRFGWRCAWTTPASRLGTATTLWLWSAAAAVVASLSAIGGGASQVPGALWLWGIVFLAWLVRRWWAERLFRPRDLPARRRWRRR